MATQNRTTSTAPSTGSQNKIDYQKEISKCEDFLTRFEKTEQYGRKYVYMDKLRKIASRETKILQIELDDITQFHSSDWSSEEFINAIERNTSRYVGLFYQAVDRVMPELDNSSPENEDLMDILWMHRIKQMRYQVRQDRRNTGQAVTSTTDDDISQEVTQKVKESFPDELRRRYQIKIAPRKEVPIVPLREVRAKHIGKLVSISGIIIRVTEVKPLILVATYTCDQCGREIFQEVTARTFLPVTICPSEICKTNNVSGSLHLQTRGSKFIKYQELKIQELAEQVPIGHVPRSMNIQVRGELTRQCAAGDIVTISGIFLPSPYSGQTGRNVLLADTFIEAMNITKHKKSYSSFEITPELQEKVKTLSEEVDAYGKLARSIAPEIFGSEDVKKALLLLMIGGVNRQMIDGMKIRGDINVCLMGDPGVAKSQLLKHISTIAPRGIYTSGKGASGVGLTAAVLRDPVTGDLVLEGGSLVLADKGICCIDEFDKMEESDRTAIHEVMEQQTISIAKAGITTTLNARTSILAAANPAFGRYNTRRSPSENINLPAALLSRFDLLFLLLDRPDLDSDLALAQHVTFVHRNGHHPNLQTQTFSPEFIRAYVSIARKYHPYIPDELVSYIVGAYTNMRKEESEQTEEFTYTTARTLLAILRLSTALARIRFDEEVSQADVDEAIRLLYVSKASLLEDKKKNQNYDPTSAIYDIIRALGASSNSQKLSMPEITNRVIAKGYTKQLLDQTLKDYEDLGVWQISSNRSELRFIV